MKNGIWLAVPAALVAFAVAASWGGESVDVLFAPTGDKQLLQREVAESIGSARKSVRVAIYQFTSRRIAEALAASKRRGVDVRVLVDASQAGQDRRYEEALQILRDAKVPLRRVRPAGSSGRDASDAFRAKFHHKFCVVDDARVLTGSYNYTVLADEENHENLVLITSRPVALKYARRFEEIWEDEDILERESSGEE